jgi:hypothetical protein
MRIELGALTIGSALVFGACAGTQSKQVSAPRTVDCSGVSSDAVAQLYAPGNVKKVTTLYRKEFVARAIQPVFVSGAKLTIPAQPNTSDAYMERALSCHAVARARMTTGGADPLSVEGVQNVRVESVGPMTEISITSTNRHAAKQIVQHAQALEQSGGSVSVQQLSLATPQSAAF